MFSEAITLAAFKGKEDLILDELRELNARIDLLEEGSRRFPDGDTNSTETASA